MNPVCIIEAKACDSVKLEAFNKVNVYGIKESVNSLLAMFGKEGIFSEYTGHNISHINKLLEMLDWLVPRATLEKMSSADCLMTTLAIYFHDLGLVVTRDEFNERDKSDFPAFRDAVLFGETDGKDYQSRSSKMLPEEKERFLYQEFVREHHAQRIKNWVMGKNPINLGNAASIVKEMDTLLGCLGDKFRRDLGIVCESHHADDLGDLDKYKTSQPYGSSPQEMANLQYCSVLLRAADLLHVTKDRTPSIAFRIINPRDPKSVEEWNKQMAVVMVKPKPAVDKDGNVDPKIPMDTVEFHGYFTDPDGFFALTAYLVYARKELRRSYEWVEQARKKKSLPHEFPWRDVDDAGLEAKGFINRQFEFTLDQAKILDLLTGHTLYNDTTVVLRELVQNSLDAIRLQWEKEAGQIPLGEVHVHWDSVNHTLTVEDNGTGMTQQIVDNHFLKVGSSRYQDDEFRKGHPEFSAISRFGIGVLSTFMISDEIEVTTCHPEEEYARRLSLRSLHGKYLIRLEAKDPQQLPARILAHGTQVKMNVRSTAKLRNFENVLRRWIVFPRCKVTLTIDDHDPVKIGFESPKDAVRQELEKLGIKKFSDQGTPSDWSVRIAEQSCQGLTMAYALEWSKYFQQWQFLNPVNWRGVKGGPLVGTCIEGIRVDFFAPGFKTIPILAVANAVGQSAPKTNVARSSLEVTREYDHLMRKIYSVYAQHVRQEVQKLYGERPFSLTWAIGEASWLLTPLLPGSPAPTYQQQVSDYEALVDACSDIPSIALEENGARVAISPKQLAACPNFWTVDSAFFSSAEALIREIPAPVTISDLAATISKDLLKLPNGPYISGLARRSTVHELAFQNREVDYIVVRQDQRRIDLRWSNVAADPIWRNGLPVNEGAAQEYSKLVTSRAETRLLGPDTYIGQNDLKREGVEGKIAIVSMHRRFILPGSAYAKYLLSLLDQIEAKPEPLTLVSYAIALRALGLGPKYPSIAEWVKREFVLVSNDNPWGTAEFSASEDLLAVLRTTEFDVFDPQAWVRH